MVLSKKRVKFARRPRAKRVGRRMFRGRAVARKRVNYARKSTYTHVDRPLTLKSNSYTVKLPWKISQDLITCAATGALNPPGVFRSYYPQFPNPGRPGAPQVGDLLYNGLQNYAEFFANFRVHSSFLRVRIVNTGSSGGNAHSYVRCVIYPSVVQMDSTGQGGTTMGAQSYEQAASVAYSKTLLLQPNQGSKSIGTFSQGTSTKRMFAVDTIRSAMSEVAGGMGFCQYGSACAASTSASSWALVPMPAQYWRFDVGVWNTETVSPANDVLVDIDVQMFSVIEFYDRVSQDANTIV